MAVTYADNTKKIVELYSVEKDMWGRQVERRLGFREVYFCDDVTGAMIKGPYIEPVPYLRHNREDKTFPELGGDIIGRRQVNDDRTGGQYGFWKHLNI